MRLSSASLAALLALLAAVSLWGAGAVTEIIPIGNGDAAAAVRTLRPFLAPGGAIDAYQDKLLIRTTPENLKELKVLLGQVDRKLRQLRIRVSHSGKRTQENSRLDVSGRIKLGPSAVVQAGAAGRPRVSFSESDNRVESDGGQEVVAQEGRPSWITDGPGGFYVTPRLTRDGGVILEVDTTSPRPGIAPASGVPATTSLRTKVRAPLGQWVDLGGAGENTAQKNSGILSRDGGEVSAGEGVRIRVDRFDQ